jgi:hypothetical protein
MYGDSYTPIVYAAAVEDESALNYCTVDACQIIRNYPDSSKQLSGGAC